MNGPTHVSARLSGLAALALVAAAVTSSPAFAQPSTQPDWLAGVEASYTTWTVTAAGALPDESALGLSLRPPAAVDLGPLPADADVDALERIDATTVWFSLAEWAELPGGLRAHPADVLSWNGVGYGKVVDAVACGGLANANVDGIAALPGLFGGTVLQLSFSTTRLFLNPQLQPFVVFDEEAVSWTPGGCSPLGRITLPGVESRLDLDALSVSPRWGILLDTVHYLSFDTWAAPGGVTGGPGSLFEFRPWSSHWAIGQLAADIGALPQGDVDALWILPGGIFDDPFESGATNRWLVVVP